MVSKTDPIYKDFCRCSKVSVLIFQTYISSTQTLDKICSAMSLEIQGFTLYRRVPVYEIDFYVFYIGNFIMFGQHLLIHFFCEKCSGNSPSDTWTVWRDAIHMELVRRLTAWPVNHWSLWHRRKILSQKSFETRNLGARWVSAMFQIEAIGKAVKMTVLTSPGNKANSSWRTRGLSILKYICCICWKWWEQ